MRIPYNWLNEYIKTDLTPKGIAQKLTLVGHALDKPLYEQEGDTVMDLEDRGNRGDVTGILGIARDLAALISEKVKYPKMGVIPTTDNSKFSPSIKVESERVIRWRAVTFKNVKVVPSPEHVQKRLKAYGMEVINNIVDITNYVMIETGMPLHAFDLDKVSKIVLRTAKPGETLVTFEGTELKFDENDLVAADDTKPLTLTTAVGGRESGIVGSTVNILFEAGLYDQPTARRSALRLNVRNETSQRLGKYLHPEYCEIAIARTIELMKEILNADPEPVSFDYYPNKYPETTVAVSRERLNLIAGEEIDLQEAGKILRSLEFEVSPQHHSGLPPVILNTPSRHPESLTTPKDLYSRDPSPAKPDQDDGKARTQNDVEKNSITVKVPYFRTDVTMEDDVIEEVLRIRGYDKIPTYLPNRPAPQKLKFPERDLEEKAKDILVSLGFTEIVSSQIVDKEDIKKAGFWDEKKVVKLENSWNEGLNVLRYDLASPQFKYLLSYQKYQSSRPVMLNSFQHLEIPNQVRDDTFGIIKIFEIGKTYSKDENLSGYEKYTEVRKIALTLNGNFLTLKANIVTFLSELGLTGFVFEKLEFSLYKSWASASIKVNGEVVGKAGEVRGSILSNFGVEGTVSHVVFYTAKLLKYAKPNPSLAVKTSFPNFVSEDRTFKVNKTAETGKLLTKLKQEMDPSTEITFLGVFENDELKKDNKKNVTFNFKFNPEKAQTESEILKGLAL